MVAQAFAVPPIPDFGPATLLLTLVYAALGVLVGYLAFCLMGPVHCRVTRKLP